MVSNRITVANEAASAIGRFFMECGERRRKPDLSDLTFGNPNEMPLAGIGDAIRAWAVPQSKDWFAYKASEAEPQTFLAEHAGRELGLAFEPADIALTAGAFAAINVAIHMVLDVGDEAIFSEPAWFCYEPMLLAAGAIPRKVRLKPPAFDLDLAAIEEAINPRTRLVIVNTPQNPTGRICDRATLTELADLLERASRRVGHRIYLLSDEPYRRLRFDGRSFVSPATLYPWTLISYSYGKVLLAPGQRIGYLAISPLMPSSERKAIRDSMLVTQMALGWCFPNAVMQYAVPDLETLSIDIKALTGRRDRLVSALMAAGYGPLVPEGTFYIWSRWPKGDPELFWRALVDRDVLVLPGGFMNMPDYFRISLTASDAMVDRALPVFAEVVQGNTED